MVNHMSDYSNGEWVNFICSWLKNERNRQNISQEELSKRSGVDRVTISRTENGRAASILTIVQLLRGLERLDLLLSFVAQEHQLSEPPAKQTTTRVDALKLHSPPDSSYPDW